MDKVTEGKNDHSSAGPWPSSPGSSILEAEGAVVVVVAWLVASGPVVIIHHFS